MRGRMAARRAALAVLVILGLVAAQATLAAAGSAGGHPHGGGTPISESRDLRRAVTVSGIREHQRALQRIADRHGGTRAAGTPGYDASVDYIVRKARAAGYKVTLDELTYVVEFTEGSPPMLDETAPEAHPQRPERRRGRPRAPGHRRRAGLA